MDSITDQTSARDFLIYVAGKINKKPEDVQKFIDALDSNWIEDVAALKQVDDDQWKSLGIPMGLVNQIKNHLKTVGVQQQPAQKQIVETVAPKKQQQQNKKDQDMQIDSSSGKKKTTVAQRLKNTAKQRSAGKAVPVAQIQLEGQGNQIDSTGVTSGSQDPGEMMKGRLNALKAQLYDQGFKAAHQECVKTLFKVLENLQLKPTDMKVRTLPKTNKAVQEKILAHDDACAFLRLVGFDFGGEQVTLRTYDNVIIQLGLDSINDHIVSLGGQVSVAPAFDPTKAQRILNTGEKLAKPPGGDDLKYDPTKVSLMIEEEKKRRMKAMEGRQNDRQVKIINTMAKSTTNLKQLLFDLDQQEITRLTEMRLSEEKMQVAEGQTSVLRFLGEQEKNSKFQNKRFQELEKLMKTPNHTRANVRIKFPDGYLLQGTFGALETVQDIYEFVGQCMFIPPTEREFYLYETPPKKVLDKKLFNKNLVTQRLVPSCMLYFGWSDLDETKQEHGPFMNMEKLKDKIVDISQ